MTFNLNNVSHSLLQLSNDLRDSDLLRNVQSRLERVAYKVDNIDNKVEDIHKYLFNSKRSASLLPPDTVVRQRMLLKPEVFHGRDDFVQDMARLLLQKETSRVCILGPGGMGKTSVSLAVVESPLLQERFPPGSRVWVPCIEATSVTLLLEILYVQLEVPGDKQVTLEKIILHLDEIKQPCLILLDNFETPWNGNTQKQVEDILRQLAEQELRHVAIFITMRGANPPCNKAIKWQWKNIEPTNKEASLHIYHDNNPSSKDDPDVGRLLTALGHMPFAVTLMANLGMEGKSTAKELFDAWIESGPDILSDSPEQSMNRSISLSVESDLVKQNPNAIILLAILSLLPAGTTKENLRWWAPEIKTSMIPSAIAALSRAGLLIENKQQNLDSPVLFVVPVVQSFMQQHDQEQRPRIPQEIRKKIQSSCCEYVLDHACRFDDPTFPVKSKALAADGTNIQSILFDTSQHTFPSDRTMEALIAFSWHRCDTKPSLEIANHTVTVVKASGVKKYTASAVWCLGKTYQQLGEYRHSYNYLQEAYQLFNSLPPGELDSQRLGGLCGLALVNLARLTSHYNHAVSLARDVELKCAALDDVLHARSLVMLGYALNDTQQRQEALIYLDRAKAILKAVGNTIHLGRAYRAIARVHYAGWRLPEALEAIQEAWKHTESSASPSDQAYVSLDFGMILFSLNKDAEAWKYIEIALTKASFIGHRLQVAITLEYMAFGYLRRGDTKTRMVLTRRRRRNTMVLLMPVSVLMMPGLKRGARRTWTGSSKSRRILMPMLVFIGLSFPGMVMSINLPSIPLFKHLRTTCPFPALTS